MVMTEMELGGKQGGNGTDGVAFLLLVRHCGRPAAMGLA